MKLNSYFVVVAAIYQGICSAAALPARSVVPLAQSRIFQEPQSDDIVFPNKQAKIVIYADNPAFGNKINGYLQDAALINQIALALNVMIIAPISVISAYDQLTTELGTPNQPERIIIAFGDNATKNLLTYLYQLNTQGIINSIILFDPVIPGARATVYQQQLIPQYNSISNRIYNFYSHYWPRRVWRKIHPALTGVPPAQLDDQYYFKGINIFTKIIDESGKVFEKFNFETMNKDSFHMLLAAIAKTNKYRLQPDLTAIIRNYSTEVTRSKALYPLRKIGADLPLVSINKPLEFIENTRTLRSEVVHIAYGAAAGYTPEYYTCPLSQALADRLKPIIENEEKLSSYVMHIQGTNEAEKEEELRKYTMVKKNPYTPDTMDVKNNAIDQVDTGIRTYHLEHDYIEKRKLIVRDALQTLCLGPAHYINIAIVASGGGSRAMFATYGALKGLEELGVLSATSYICGLSGSTWAISTLFIHANIDANISVAKALENASRQSAQQANEFGFFTSAFLKVPTHYFTSYPTALQVKSLFNEPITNTDWYGSEIGRTLLGTKDDFKHKNYEPYYLTKQLGETAQWKAKEFRIPDNYVPRLPFPIYTAVTPLYMTETRLFPWFEFTPYEIGTVLGRGDLKTGMFVKTWAFGREFEGGISRDFAPEQTLEFYLGVFGSAMNSTLHETLAMAPGWAEPLIQGGKYLASWTPGTGHINTEYRWRFAEVFNPMYGLKDAKFADYSANKTIGLIDAGLSFNLPFPPLNDHGNQRPDRKPDVVIFIDASADAKDVNISAGKQAWPKGNALWAVERYAREDAVAFPALPLQKPSVNLAAETCQIFKEQFGRQAQRPLVIYLPVTKNITEISDQATFNGVNLLNKVKHDNTIEKTDAQIVPIDLGTINLDNYKTQKTGLSEQDAVDLMALMQYNVLNNGERIKREICDRARAEAGR